jgi:HD superfamily phosphohydrolase
MFLCKLLEDPEFRMMASAPYVRAALLVALLHDIGHYPLSHAFEDFCEDVTTSEVTSERQILADSILFDSFV